MNWCDAIAKLPSPLPSKVTSKAYKKNACSAPRSAEPLPTGETFSSIYLDPFVKQWSLKVPSSPNVFNLVNPDPEVRKKKLAVLHLELRNWTNDASAQGKRDAAQGLRHLLSGDLTKAERFLTQAAEADPGAIHFRFLLAETFRLQRRPEEALWLLEDIKRHYQGTGATLAAAMLYWFFRNYQKAEEEFLQICRIDDKNPTPWFLRGTMNAERGKLSLSLMCLKAAKLTSTESQEINRCLMMVQDTLKSGVSHSVNCGVNPLTVPVCIGM